MAADKFLLFSVLACMSVTTWSMTTVSTTTPQEETCQYQGVTYKVDSTIEVTTCLIGYCYGQDEIEFSYRCCEYGGKTYEIDPDTDISNDPCSMGVYCDYGGQVSIIYRCCSVPECPNPFYIDGQCCARCPEEWTKGGQRIPVDSCNFAFCDNNNRVAYEPPCCEFNGTMYPPQTTFVVDTCVSAFCQSGTSIDFINTCCQYEGNTYDLNSQFMINSCIAGSCDEYGNLAIYGMSCDSASCEEYSQELRDCCGPCSTTTPQTETPLTPTQTWIP